eukprot:1512022-Amphidinium_carterae.3
MHWGFATRDQSNFNKIFQTYVCDMDCVIDKILLCQANELRCARTCAIHSRKLLATAIPTLSILWLQALQLTIPMPIVLITECATKDQTQSFLRAAFVLTEAYVRKIGDKTDYDLLSSG